MFCVYYRSKIEKGLKMTIFVKLKKNMENVLIFKFKYFYRILHIIKHILSNFQLNWWLLLAVSLFQLKMTYFTIFECLSIIMSQITQFFDIMSIKDWLTT